MPTFKKRVFGAEVEEDIKLEFERLATGGRIVETKTTPRRSGVEGEILKSVNPTYEDYLGDKTPQCRMWCAVAINAWNGWGNYKGERITQNSAGDWFYFPNEDKGAGTKTVGKDSEAIRLVFSVNQHNEENNYTNPLASKDIPEDSSSKIKHFKQLTNNPLMKPAAGITSIRAKSQGAIGAMISATVEFVVHNKFDFENIFLPYFLKPGSIVCLDYGWSDVPMYDIMSAVGKGDIDMSSFDNDIYNPKTGFQARNFGKVRTVMGNVVSYDANVTNEGSYECSIEIVSRNAGLLEKKVEGSLQNLFVNSINDVLAVFLAKIYGLEKSFSLEHIRKNLTSAEPVDTRQIAKRLISEFSENSDNLGIIPESGVANGIFHQDMAPNKTFFSTDHYNRVKNIKGDESKSATDVREAIVSDDILNKERTYISYGLFEDLFLNNFAKGVIKNKLEIDTSGKSKDAKVKSKSFSFPPGLDFDNNFDTRLTYIRWSKLLVRYQRAELVGRESLPLFMIPDNWDKSYNAIELGINLDKTPDKNSDIKWNVSTERQKSGKHPNYRGIKVMPLRDLFISVNAVQTAFESNPTVNGALMALYDEINEASGNTIGLRLVTNEGSTTISAQDVNLNPIEEKRLEFDVTGTKSIVSNLDLKYTTPKDGLSSILAIGSLNGPQTFTDLDLSQFSFLNLLNKPTIPDQYIHVRNLPNQGNLNRLTSEEDGLTLSFTGLNRFLSDYEPERQDKPKGAKDKIDLYYQSIKETGIVEKESVDNSERSITEYENPKAYQYMLKRADTFNSDRDMIKAEIREELHDADTEGSIAPILPIELSLGIYGNTYLQIGDRFTINYLPEYYKNRVYFQIMQFEDEITPNGWTTNYQSLMRVEPKVKSIVTGAPGYRSKEKFLDPNKLPRSKTTGAVKSIRDLDPKVIKAADEMGAAITPLSDLLDDTELLKSMNRANLMFKANRIIFAPSTQWTDVKPIVQTTNISAQQLNVGGAMGGANVGTGKTTKENFDYLLRYQISSMGTFQKLKAKNNLAYAYAIRKLILGEKSPIDFDKVKVLFSDDMDGSVNTQRRLNEGTKAKQDLVVHLDDIASFWTYEEDLTDNITAEKIIAVYNVDFKLHPKIIENSKGYPKKLDQETMSYDQTPLLVKRFFFGLDIEKNKESNQEAITITEEGIDVFKHLSIPKHMLKESNYKVIIGDIIRYYLEYQQSIDDIPSKQGSGLPPKI